MVFSFSPFFSAYAGSTSSNYSPSCSCFGIRFYPNNPFQKRQYGPLCLILWASSVGLQWPWFPPASNWWSRWINWFWSSEDKTSKKMGGKKNQNDDCECLGNSCKHKWQIPIYPLSDSAGAKILSRPIYHCFSFTQLGMGPVGLRKSWNQTFARPNIAITKCQPMTNASDVGIVAEICDMAPCFWVLGRSMEPPQKSATAANHQQLLYPSLWVCQLALRFWNHGGAFCRPPSPLLQPSFARSLSLHLGLAEF